MINQPNYRQPHRPRHVQGGWIVFVLSLILIAVTSQPVVAYEVSRDRGEAVVASAPNDGSTGTSATTPVNDGVVPGELPALDPSDFSNRYASLSEALLSSRPQLGTGLEGWGSSLSTEKFDSFSQGGFTLDSGRFDTLSAYTSEFFSKGGADGAVAAAASAYATQLAGVYAPKIDVGSFEMGTLEVPEEGMLFGLVFDQSLTGLLGDSTLLAGIANNDINSPEVQSSWNDSMLQASQRVDRNLGDLLVSSCYGAFLAGLGGGESAIANYGFSNDCTPCATSGLYLNSEMNRLLDPSYDSQYFDPQDSVITPSEYVQVPNWLKDPLAAYDPDKARQLEGVKPRALGTQSVRDCNTSATAGAAALGNMLDGLDVGALLKTSPGR